MMMPTLVDMPMLQLFGSRLTQIHNFHIEMQLIARQRMIEVQRHSIAFNGIDARIAGLTGIISDGQFQTFLNGHILGELRHAAHP